MPKNRFHCSLFSHPQDRQSGDYLYRVIWPGKTKERFIPVHAIQSCHPDRLRELAHSDVLAIQMVADVKLLGVIMERRQQGKITAFEFYNGFTATAIPAHLPGQDFYTSKEIQQTFATLASESDAVRFSNLFLVREYSHYSMITHVRGVSSLPASPC